LIDVGGATYTWDDNGNLVNDGTKSYTYNQANQLTNISGAGLTWSASYNGEGARVRQVSNGTVTTYTLDLATPLVQVLMMQDAGGKTVYLYGVMRIGEQQPGGWVYHLSDALGSVRQLADGSGNVVLARGYSPYGEPLWMNGTASSRYAFTGEDYDPTVGLVFLRARYMQPTLGIFLARDPLNGVPVRPRSFHPYSYAEGNVINATDPMGLCTRCRRGSVVTVQSPQAGVTEINVRSSPSAADDSNIVTTLSNGAQVVIAEDAPLAGGGFYWHSTYLSRWLGGGIGINYGQVWIWNDALVDDPDDPGPNPPPPGPDLDFGFKFTDWPVPSPTFYQPFGPNLYAYCTAALEGLSDDEKAAKGCPSCYLSLPNQYRNLHGLHNGVDFGAPDGTEVKWTASAAGTVLSVSTFPDALPNVVIEIGNYDVIFGHTSAAECVAAGTIVQYGDLIGKTTGGQNHLHLGVVSKDNLYYFLNPASAFAPNSDALGAEYAPGYGAIGGFSALGGGSYWDGSFTP
jgi:RHS repeat-associated protein